MTFAKLKFLHTVTQVNDLLTFPVTKTHTHVHNTVCACVRECVCAPTHCRHYGETEEETISACWLSELCEHGC